MVISTCGRSCAPAGHFRSIPKEQGLFADELAKVAALYKQAEAVANKSNFARIREETLKVVNK